jgi:membrane protease YdiL (CAAX protease family)
LVFICLKKKQYSLIRVKVNEFTLLLIPLYFICDIFKLSHTLLVIITLFYFIQYLDKKETKSFNFAIFKSSLSHLICCWPLILLISIFSMSLFSDFNEQEIVSKLKKNVSYSLLFSSIIMAPVFEEIFFRKFVYRVIKKKLGIFFGILISSLMFGLIHYNLYSFGTLFLLSIICTIKYENTGQIYYPILIHSFFNTIMVIFTLV